MTCEARKMPRCSMCGTCCSAAIGLIMTPGDYRRWKRQGRSDILRYTWKGTPQGDGDLWIDPDTGEELIYCPFLKEVCPGKYTCTIQDTKPTVCREYWCEWSYGIGKKGVAFRTDGGWEEKARQLGYG